MSLFNLSLLVCVWMAGADTDLHVGCGGLGWCVSMNSLSFMALTNKKLYELGGCDASICSLLLWGQSKKVR